MPNGPKLEEFRTTIAAYTPETMPMARLAEYITELAKILGETSSVHLLSIEPGSTTLVHAVNHEAVPKVRARAEAVRIGGGPRDARDSYRRVNRLLREDNAKAVLQEGTNGRKTVLEFPGADEAEPTFPSVSQVGVISGVVIRVGGTGDSVPVLLESEGQPIVGCHANRVVAKGLARYLFEPVRLSGNAYWMRDAGGRWILRHFRIDAFEALDNTTLSAALTELRAITSKWDDNAFDELQVLRHGESE